MKIDLAFFLWLGLGAVILLGIGWALQQYQRAREMLEDWAERNQIQIEKSELRHFFKGPFFWGSSRGQFVYRVHVIDRAGQRRTGWVRVGSWFWGIWKNQVNVIWDDESSG